MGRTITLTVASALAVTLTGCMQQHLQMNTLSAGTTVADIYYQQVLYNLAVVSVDQWAVPSQVKVTGGLIQIADTIQPQLKVTWPPHVTPSEELQVFGSRQMLGNWQVVPVTDPEQLRRLQKWYRWAWLRQRQWTGAVPTTQYGIGIQYRLPTTCPVEELPGFGWIKFGKSLPPGTRFSACYRGQYAWVPDDRLEDFVKFTLIIMNEARKLPEDQQLQIVPGLMPK